jgi:5-methylcytosine-specific restriction endonuclease McrA
VFLLSPKDQRCLDHVVPRAKNGRNSYRNLVLACVECNSLKGERSAADHLSRLFREGRLTDAQLPGRFRALDDLAAGKLRPQAPLPKNET